MGVKVREKPKGSGEYYVFIAYKNRRKAKRIGRDKRLAVKVAKQIEAKLLIGDFDMNEKPTATFGDYAEKYIRIHAPHENKVSTVINKVGYLRNHLLPVYGNIPITDIKKGAIKEFLIKKSSPQKGKGLAPDTVQHIKDCLSRIFALAVDDEVITVNPAKDLGRIAKVNMRRYDKSIDPLTEKELTKLLNAFQSHFPEHFPLVLTLAKTGIRIGEAAGLNWSDINFEGRYLVIQRGYSNGRLDTPKNHKSRKVDMTPNLADVLWHLRRERKNEMGAEMPEWVFPNKAGKNLEARNWRKRVFNKAVELAELSRRRIHDLRHSYASILLMRNVPILYVSRQLGHSSIRITLDIYGHLLRDENIENGLLIDELDGFIDLDNSATKRNLSATIKENDSHEIA